MEETDKNPDAIVGYIASEQNNPKDKEKIERMAATEKETIHRMQNDPAIKQYLSGYSKGSVIEFIKWYAQTRASYIENGELYQSYIEKSYSKYSDCAMLCLEEIQLKKLFDLRCQWGAKLVDIAGVDISKEIENWGENVLNCPFLPPITQEEFDLYYSYAQSKKFVIEEDYMRCDIFYIKRGLGYHNYNDVDISNWFEYHNIHTGANKYMLYPDIRGEKEGFYRDLYKNANRKNQTETPAGALPVTQEFKPSISCFDYDQILDFIIKFEDAKSKRLFESYNQYRKYGLMKNDAAYSENCHLNETVDDIICYLSDFKDVVLPVEANKDWRLALIAAWDKWEKEQVVKRLPNAYDSYLFRIECRIPFEQKEREHFEINIVSLMKKQILAGRELNGEPQDFNY